MSTTPSSGGYQPPDYSSAAQGLQPVPVSGSWKRGVFGCLLLLIAFGIIGTLILRKVISGARHLVGSLHSTITKDMAIQPNTPEDQACIAKMRKVYTAVVAYHARTGTYPLTLSALVPNNLSAADLHCSLDLNADPRNISFTYIRPPAGDSPDAAYSVRVPLLAFHRKISVSDGALRKDKAETLSMSLDGSTDTERSNFYH